MILTNELLLAAQSDNKGWSAAQLRLLGFDGFQKGWRRKVTGSNVDEEVYKEVVRIRNAHLARSNTNTKPVSMLADDRWANDTRAILLAKKNEAEAHVDSLLRKSSFTYSREQPIEVDGKKWFIDFHIRRIRIGKKSPMIGVALEIDGGYHFTPEQQAFDKRKDEDLLCSRMVNAVVRISADNAIRMDMHTLCGIVINPISYSTKKHY